MNISFLDIIRYIAVIVWGIHIGYLGNRDNWSMWKILGWAMGGAVILSIVFRLVEYWVFR